MAITAFRARVENGSPYTVPAGKRAVFSANWIGEPATASDGQRIDISIGGVKAASIVVKGSGTQLVFTPTVKPLTANAGEAISVSADAIAIVGHLYDV